MHKFGGEIGIKKRINEVARDIHVMDSRAWEKRTKPTDLDYVFTILIDCSGSMWGERVFNAYLAGCSTGEALQKLNLPCQIVLFNKELEEIKGFNEVLSREKYERMWGRRFFSRFLMDDDSGQFWSKAESEWSETFSEWLSVDGTRLTEINVGIGKAGTPSLGFLKRQQEISELEEEAQKLQQHCSRLEEELEQKQLKLSELRSEHQNQLKSQRETELEWLSVSKELEHHQHEQKRLGQIGRASCRERV